MLSVLWIATFVQPLDFERPATLQLPFMWPMAFFSEIQLQIQCQFTFEVVVLSLVCLVVTNMQIISCL